MARGKKTGGRNFVKGQVANPKGVSAPRDPIKRLLKTEFQDMVSLVVKSNPEDLKKIIQDPNSTAGQILMASALLQDIKKGSITQLLSLAEQVLGRPKETHEHSVANPYTSLTKEQLDSKLKELESSEVSSLPLRDVTPDTKDN